MTEYEEKFSAQGNPIYKYIIYRQSTQYKYGRLQKTEKWVKEVYEKILTKEEQVAKRNAHKIPYTTKDGVFDDKSGKEICWWTKDSGAV